MKESYGQGLATHTDPESCGAAREGGRSVDRGTCGPLVWRAQLQPGEIVLILGQPGSPANKKYGSVM
jgi:hypothetical protein